VAEKDRLYRCLDRVLEHTQELVVWLKRKWADLFHADFEVLRRGEHNPKAKRGYSRDKRPDCPPWVMARVVSPRARIQQLSIGLWHTRGVTRDTVMARGWESKSVESQIESAESKRAASCREQCSAIEADRIQQRQSLLLSRTRVLHDLEHASNPRYRQILEAALKHLDQKLGELQ
jgi:hypothetical protein